MYPSKKNLNLNKIKNSFSQSGRFKVIDLAFFESISSMLKTLILVIRIHFPKVLMRITLFDTKVEILKVVDYGIVCGLIVNRTVKKINARLYPIGLGNGLFDAKHSLIMNILTFSIRCFDLYCTTFTNKLTVPLFVLFNNFQCVLITGSMINLRYFTQKYCYIFVFVNYKKTGQQPHVKTCLLIRSRFWKILGRLLSACTGFQILLSEFDGIKKHSATNKNN
ncbi:hypothetical protein BpHYR1_011249 [Brachionus plicatilis]|uniref:Uncharacterized protein n=1 Tax=Brachionus plicatilis TaxID=10195 RepID=A0A3M7RC49_BRAPC|nr:hypothetical protein BpHYR1_011249 [Brachionus plicatilis]